MAGLGRIASAILGLLALQNREKLGEVSADGAAAGASPGAAPPEAPVSSKPGLLEELIDGIWSGDGLDEVLDTFRRSGSTDEAESWVSREPNKPLTIEQVRAAIDPDTLGELADQTGLPPNELLRRIATDLPEAVDRLTPEGHLPAPMPKETDRFDDLPPRQA
jgi:uncharacterized protein YidB (DUF937 family)